MGQPILCLSYAAPVQDIGRTLLKIPAELPERIDTRGGRGRGRVGLLIANGPLKGSGREEAPGAE